MFDVLWRFAALTLIPVTLALSGVLTAAHRLPLPEIEAGLSLCETRPCWAGLEPGRTPIDTVQTVVTTSLENAPVNFQRYQRYTHYVVEVPSHNVLGAISAQGGTVSSIRLNVVQPLWPLLLVLDKPLCIEPIDNRYDVQIVNIYWEIDGVYVMSNLGVSRWNPDLLTNALFLWVPTSTAPCDKFGQVLPWPGYAALR